MYLKAAKVPVKKVFVRLPLPYKVGEAPYPGNAEEKLRCEAATYIWIQNNCPDVPIPHLRGFGFSNGHSFSAPENTPLLIRVTWAFRRTVLRSFGYPVPSRYVPRQSPWAVRLGREYLIIDAVENGQMLSESWKLLRHD